MKTLIVALTLLAALHAHAADITLAWDASPSTDVASYRIYRSNQPPNSDGVFATPIAMYDVGNVLTVTIPGLPDGPHYFAATAVSVNGLESGYSNVVHTIIGPPLPPGNLRITQQTVKAWKNDATVKWSTTIPAIGVIEYGDTPELGQSIAVNQYSQKHVDEIHSLTRKTVYYYKITAMNDAGDIFVGGVNTFTTK